jgi:hypothetical protein
MAISLAGKGTYLYSGDYQGMVTQWSLVSVEYKQLFVGKI